MEQSEFSIDENSIALYSDDSLQLAGASNGRLPKGGLFKEIQGISEKKQDSPLLHKCRNVYVGTTLVLPPGRKKDDKESRNDIYKNCSEKLKYRYVTYFAYMRSYLWPEKYNDFPLNEYFVELAVEKADLFGKKRGEKIYLNEIFANEEDGHKTILVTGNPGYGKTTLCKKIAYDWATKEYLQHFQLTVVIILRELSNKSIKDEVLDDIQPKSRSNGDGRFHENLNILVIFDGFDELTEKQKVVDFIREESFEISNQMTIIVTSRNEATEDIREYMQLRFSIEGFSAEHQKKYIQLMFKESETQANDLIQKLEDDDFYKELAQCPLMLHMLCCLHQNGDMKNIENITELYVRIFQLVTERYVRKNNQDDKFKPGKYFYGEDILCKLGDLHARIHPITSEKLRETFSNEEEYNFIIGLGILVINLSSQRSSSIHYEFMHRTFSEFLSAFMAFNDFKKRLLLSWICTGNTFLFLLGFFRTTSFPQQLIPYLQGSYSAKLMFQALKQMELRANLEKFCSLSIVYANLFTDELDVVKTIFKDYPLKELYLIFPNSVEVYEEKKEEIFDFFSSGNFPSDLKISIFLVTVPKLPSTTYDIRQSISCIIDLYSFIKVKLTNHEIYFAGMYEYNYLTYTFHSFRNMISPECIPEELVDSENDKVVALQTNLNVDGIFNNYLLSLEQYETLRDFIKIDWIRNPRVHKSICNLL